MPWKLLLPTELFAAVVLGFLAESVVYFTEKKDRLHTHGVAWGPFDRRPPVRYSFLRAMAFASGSCIVWLLADFVIMIFPHIHSAYSWLFRVLGVELTELFATL